MEWSPLYVTAKLACFTTFILVGIGIPVAYWLCYGKSRLKPVVETLITLPLVLPPSVLGFYLLVAFDPQRGLGRFLENNLGLRLVFSFEGILVASLIFSLPFMVNPILNGFQHLPISLVEASYTLGKSSWYTLWYVLLPNIRPSLFVAVVMTFAHTVGEFGLVLMIGGNIPDETRVASIAIYHEVEALNYDTANQYALILLIFSFVTLLGVNILRKR